MSWQDATGKQHRRVVSAQSREEAKAALLRLRLEQAEGRQTRFEMATQTTLGEWCQAWVATDLPRLAVGAQTAANYRINLAAVKHSPHADAPLDEIGVEQSEALLAWRLKTAPSRTSARLLRAALSRALGDAERRGVIVRNPARLARLPAEAVPVKERRALAPEEAKALGEAVEGEPDEAFWLSMLLLGLTARGGGWAHLGRRGHRRWRAPRRRSPQVDAQRLRARTAQDPPGSRALKTPPRLAKAFAKLPQGKPEALVFPTPSGGPRDPSNDRHRLARICRRAGLPVVTPYELRHTAASLLSDAGAPIEVVADLLGHSTTQMLEQVCRHRVRKVVNPGLW